MTNNTTEDTTDECPDCLGSGILYWRDGSLHPGDLNPLTTIDCQTCDGRGYTRNHQ